MKSRTLLYCLAVCLALAIVLTVPSKAPSTAAPSPHPTPDLAKLGQPRVSIEPVAPMAATSLWNASLLVSSLLADDSNGGVVFQQDHPYNPALPTAEEAHPDASCQRWQDHLVGALWRTCSREAGRVHSHAPQQATRRAAALR